MGDGVGEGVGNGVGEEGRSSEKSKSGENNLQFDPDAMIKRFAQRAAAVRERGLPPVEGPQRQRLREQAQVDFTDYSIIADAKASLDNGILTLIVDLSPPNSNKVNE